MKYKPLTVADLIEQLQSRHKPTDIVQVWNHVKDRAMPVVETTWYDEGVVLQTPWREFGRLKVLRIIRRMIARTS